MTDFEARNRRRTSVLGWLALGALGAWLLDPNQGRRRRALLRDGLGARARRLAELAEARTRDLRNRASGAVAEVRGALASGPVSDDTLHERVRSAIGRAVSNPGVVDVEVDAGRVTLRGPVLAREQQALERAARRVRGVQDVSAQLEPIAPPPGEAEPQGRSDDSGRGTTDWRRGPASLGLGIIPLAAVGALLGGRLAGRRAGARSFTPPAGARADLERERGQRTVREVMTSRLVACTPDATAADAARLMKENDIGDVLVRDGDRLAGIVTDRDLTIRVLAEDRHGAERPVRDVCSHDVATVSPEDTIDRAVELMRERAVRRLPVCEGEGRLVGVVSIGDLALERDRLSALGHISAAPPNR